MDISKLIFLIVCGIGFLNSCFIIGFLATSSKGVKTKNRLLSLLILTFSIRVSKAIWIQITPEVHPLYHILWYSSFVLMSYLYLFYLLNILKQTKYLKRFFIFLSLSLVVSFVTVKLTGLYSGEMAIFSAMVISMALLQIPVILVAKKTFNRTELFSQDIKLWSRGMIFFHLLIVAVFSLFFFIRYPFLLAESYLFSLTTYLVIFMEMKHKIFSKIHKKDHLPPRIDQSILKNLDKLIREEKIYLDPDLSLPRLAEMLKTSTHALSQLLNGQFKENFNDFINRHRIEEAKIHLGSQNSSFHKISALAFGCGFNSLSVFNTTFKKISGITPSEFQKKSKH